MLSHEINNVEHGSFGSINTVVSGQYATTVLDEDHQKMFCMFEVQCILPSCASGINQHTERPLAEAVAQNQTVRNPPKADLFARSA